MGIPRLFIFLVVKTFIVEVILGIFNICLWTLGRLDLKGKSITILKIN